MTKILTLAAILWMNALTPSASWAQDEKTNTAAAAAATSPANAEKKEEPKAEKKEEKKSDKKDGKKEKPTTKKDTKKMSEPIATFKTSLGTFKVKLFKEKAPKTVENFIALATGTKEWTDPNSGQKVKKPLYNGTIFHRIIPDFMIQGGDPLGKGIGGPGYKFEDEFKADDKFDKPGILAMANAGPNTNGSQFFITVVPTPWLARKHTIFGEVTEGMDVVMKMSKVDRGPMDKPKTDVKLESVEIQQ